MKCSIQLGFASLNRTFHLSPHENICTIALITIHYLYNITHVVFICKAFYYSCLRELDDSDNRNASSTYQRTNLTKSEILINHRSVLSSFGVNTKDDDIDLPSLLVGWLVGCV